jgi:hypothetical protein
VKTAPSFIARSAEVLDEREDRDTVASTPAKLPEIPSSDAGTTEPEPVTRRSGELLARWRYRTGRSIRSLGERRRL